MSSKWICRHTIYHNYTPHKLIMPLPGCAKAVDTVPRDHPRKYSSHSARSAPSHLEFLQLQVCPHFYVSPFLWGVGVDGAVDGSSVPPRSRSAAGIITRVSCTFPIGM